MKFTSLIRLLIMLSCSAALRAQEPSVAPGQTPGSATNQAPADATNTLAAPQVPGDIFTNSIDMVLIKSGDYWAGKFEVTQKEFQAVMGSNPSQFTVDTRPVDSVNWQDAMSFCQKLTDTELNAPSNALPKGFYYTLPTEDEWQSLVGDADLKDAVTSQSAPRSGTSPVGSLGPNSAGLYDVRGNVLEFCLGDTDKPYRVLRGGCWDDSIEVNLRPEFRVYARPDESKNTFGFRVLLKRKADDAK